MKKINNMTDFICSKYNDILDYIQGIICKKYKDNLEKCENFINELKADNELKNYWNNKYRIGKITYKGRPLPFSNININIPVNILITPNDPFIIEDLKKWNLYKTGEDPETLVPKIYKKIKTDYYKYAYDRNTWGTNELWEFPFEVREMRKKGKGVDCDSWSHFKLSYYIAAGVPNWMVKVVCGNTDLGGHSTIYVYSKKDNTWHHINSTYGKNYSNVKTYPTHDDARNGKDKIGINNVWFSFNNEFCWYKFKSDLPDELKSE